MAGIEALRATDRRRGEQPGARGRRLGSRARTFDAVVEAEVERARRYQRSLTVLRCTLRTPSDPAAAAGFAQLAFRRSDEVFRRRATVEVVAPEIDDVAADRLRRRVLADVGVPGAVDIVVATYPEQARDVVALRAVLGDGGAAQPSGGPRVSAGPAASVREPRAGFERVLVTGVAGFVGSHLAEALVAQGHDVVGVDAFVPSYDRAVKERNLATLRRGPRFTFVEADLRHAPLEPLLEGVDAVVNEAAIAGLPRSWRDVASYVECNVTGLSRLVDASRAQGVRRFVQASTSSVYGVDACGDEDRPLRPVSPYGITKLAAEQLLLAHHVRDGFPATILRYFSIYGPRQRPDMAYHIFVERLRRGQPLHVYGDGQQSRSNTYVDDIVRGTIAALHRAEPGAVYNLGGGAELTLSDAIALLADELGVRPQLVHEAARPGDQRRTAADTSRAARAFGYVPTVEPREGLRRQVEWHLATSAVDRPARRRAG